MDTYSNKIVKRYKASHALHKKDLCDPQKNIPNKKEAFKFIHSILIEKSITPKIELIDSIYHSKNNKIFPNLRAEFKSYMQSSGFESYEEIEDELNINETSDRIIHSVPSGIGGMKKTLELSVKGIAIISNDEIFLQKLEIFLNKNNVALIYKKPFKGTAIAAFLLNSLELLMHGFKTIYLINVLKSSIINNGREDIIDFIVVKALRALRYNKGLLGIRENLSAMPEAVSFLNKLEGLMLPISDVQSRNIADYIMLTMSYIKHYANDYSFNEAKIFFEMIENHIEYPVNSLEEYYSIIIFFIEQHRIIPVAPPGKGKVIYAFDKIYPFIEEKNIVFFSQEEAKNEQNIRVQSPSKQSANPSIGARPRAMSATMVQCLINNPYDFYLKYILKIAELEPLNKKPGALEFGILLHEVLAKFTVNYEISFEEVQSYAQKTFSRYTQIYSYAKHLWMKKIEKKIKFFVEFHNARAPHIESIQAEIKLETEINGIKIFARLDRIEFLKDGTMAIIDYKTGKIATKADMEQYKAVQILIQGIVAQHSYEKGISELVYCGFDEGITCINEEEAQSAIHKAESYLEGLLEQYINNQNPFIAPLDPNKY